VEIVRYDLDRVAAIQPLRHAPSQPSDHGDLAADPVERLPVDPSALFYAGTTRVDTVIRLKDSHGKKPEGDITSVERSRAFFLYDLSNSVEPVPALNLSTNDAAAGTLFVRVGWAYPTSVYGKGKTMDSKEAFEPGPGRRPYVPWPC
jgi:hypothetical protein